MRTHLVNLGSGPVHYADFGGDGYPLLLIHGLGGAHVNWMSVGGRLARGHRVLAVDLIGFGLTPRAGRMASLESNRDHIDRFITEVMGGRATLVGNSMGGLLTILEAAARPEHVRAAVLVDPALPRPRRGAPNPLLSALFLSFLTPGVGEVAMRTRHAMAPEKLVERTLALVARDPGSVAGEVLEAHLEMARRRHGSRDADRAFLQASRSLLVTLALKARFYEKVRKITCPTLLVHGAHDQLVPVKAARELAAIRPDWSVHIFDDLGHVPQLEDPAALLSVVEPWLDGVRVSQDRRSVGRAADQESKAAEDEDEQEQDEDTQGEVDIARDHPDQSQAGALLAGLPDLAAGEVAGDDGGDRTHDRKGDPAEDSADQADEGEGVRLLDRGDPARRRRSTR